MTVTSRGPRWLTGCEALYGFLLHAYPRSYRADVGSEMREAFRDQLRAVHRRTGTPGVVRLVVRAALDAVANGLAERMATRRAGRVAAVWGQPGSVLRTRSGMEAIGLNLKQAIRRLRRSPGFTLATISTVALGVAAFASIFSVVNGVLLKPLPYRDAGDLMWIWRDYTWFGFPRGWLGGPDIVELREHADVFEDVVALRNGTFNLTSSDGSAAEEVDVILSSANLFRTLGVTPMLGRGFAEGEDAPEASSVVVLGYELWRRRFGGDASIVGRDILLDGQTATVIGVMRRDFHFVKHGSLVDPEGADLYATYQRDLAQLSPNSGAFAGLARIRKGTPPEAVTAALATMSHDLDHRYFKDKGIRYWGVRLEEDLVSAARPALVALLGAGFFLLLVLCANLAALVFGRAAERLREISVRKALGASRTGTLLPVAGETLLVTAAGSVVGLVLAYWGTRALAVLTPPNMPRREDIGLDVTVVIMTLGITVLLGLLAGVPASLQALRQPTEAGLRSSSARAGGDPRSGLTRRILVIGQVALSLMLLVGAGLVARSFSALLRASPGFETTNVLTFRVRLDPSRYPDEPQAMAFHTSLRERLSALPGVRFAGATSSLPLASSTDQSDILFPGAPGNTGDEPADRPLVDYFAVTPGYIEAMGIPLRSGRSFDASDAAGGARIALIDESLASRFFPGTDPVGRTLVLGDTLRIVGVVGHARFYSVQTEDRGQVYRPYTQDTRIAMYYALSVSGGEEAIGRAAQSAVHAIDASAPVTELRSMDDIVSDSLGQERLSFWLLGGFGLCGMLLVTLGIYGVVASGVTRRTHEVGIRLALGAAPRRVLGLVIREGVAAAAIGMGLGFAGAIFTSRLLRGLLFGLGPTDPPTYLAVGAALMAVAIVAAWIPARRATRIAPLEALRID
jgi:putative ABC transport system permease protein